MADLRVKCINKLSRNNTHEGITHIGGDNWRKSREQVVRDIEQGVNTFYTFVNGRRADVGVRTSAYGTQYVQTHADGYWNDNLLALPEC